MPGSRERLSLTKCQTVRKFCRFSTESSIDFMFNGHFYSSIQYISALVHTCFDKSIHSCFPTFRGVTYAILAVYVGTASDLCCYASSIS